MIRIPTGPAILLVAALALAPAARADGPAAETVTIFVQPDGSPLARAFETEHLPALEERIRDLDLEVKVVDARRGAPADVHVTPLVVYQNHRGRAIYQGRFTTFGRLEGFVRTAQVIPQAARPRMMDGAPVVRLGRATVATPVKVTALSGAVDLGHDPAGFEEEARAAILGGFERLKRSDRALERSDRAFYLDFYPHRSGDTLHVSMAIFSQFDCHDAIYRTKRRAPVSGRWSERVAVFANAARALEAALLEQIGRADSGDGFTPVADTVPVATWDALGLALPPAPANARPVRRTDLELPQSWALPSPAGDAASVLFAFAAPMDFYTGRAGAVRASLSIDPTSIEQATGRFEVDTGSITMGEDDLDAAVRDAPILDVANHPTATFDLESIEIARGTLAYGELAEGLMRGTFTVRGRATPLEVVTSFEPVIGADGRPRLRLATGWSIRLLGPFGIVGPDGPAPANDTVLFTAIFELEPTGASQ